MKIIEVKNNLVKISFDTNSDNLVLSGFVVIKESLQSFIGQIIHLESGAGTNSAIIKLIFTFNDEGIITNYNGSIPSTTAEVEHVETQELLSLLPVNSPVFIGEIAQQKIKLALDKKLLEEKLLVCCEKESNKELLIENISSELASSGNKVLVIDLNGDMCENINFASKLTAGIDFKLPLNYETINFIYEKGLEDASSETKALIQEVFLEVQDYVKSLEEKFIPFESFKSVVDSQYEESELIELLLLKNKLLKFYDEGVFAQEKREFSSLKDSLLSNYLTVLDLSKTEEKIQREMISFAYATINEIPENFYVAVNINDENTDKKLLKQIFSTKNAFSTIVCEYSYKYLKELKQLSKNLILFAPVQQQTDFASYNVFLNKIHTNEFIIYGQATQHMPLIIKLEKAPQVDLTSSVEPEIFQTEEEIVEEPEYISAEDILDEEIRSDVDKIYAAPKSETPHGEIFSGDIYANDEEFNAKASTIQDEEIEEEFAITEDDLDFIEQELSENTEEEIPEDDETIEINVQETINELPEAIINQEEAVSFNEEPQGVESTETQESEDNFSDFLKQQSEESFINEPPAIDILPANIASTPIVPIYSADVEPAAQSDELSQGDVISHPKYGKGTVEKMISYGAKTLCSINFDNVGRRLLDPTLAELKKI